MQLPLAAGGTRSHNAKPLFTRMRFMSPDDPTTAKIRRILKEHGRLAHDPETLGASSDLYQAGMTSHASVNVLLALEGEFEVEFPDRLLKRNVFESIASIQEAVAELKAA